MDGDHLSVGTVATLVAGQASARVETRLEGLDSARLSDTGSLGKESRNDGSIVGLELSGLRLDEFNSRDQRFDRVSASSAQVSLGKGAVSSNSVSCTSTRRPAILTGGARSTGSLADSESSIDTLLGPDSSNGAVVVTPGDRAGTGNAHSRGRTEATDCAWGASSGVTGSHERTRLAFKLVFGSCRAVISSCAGRDTSDIQNLTRAELSCGAINDSHRVRAANLTGRAIGTLNGGFDSSYS